MSAQDNFLDDEVEEDDEHSKKKPSEQDAEGEGGEEAGSGDEEGEGEGNASGSVDSSEEEELSGQNEYEEDGFVVNDNEEEEGGEEDEDGEAARRRKKRKKAHRDRVENPDEEDWEIAEQGGARRPAPAGLKRLKKAEKSHTQKDMAAEFGIDENADLEDVSDDDGGHRVGGSGGRGRGGGGGGGGGGRSSGRDHRHDDGDGYGNLGDDEMADFIESDGDDGEAGDGMQRRRRVHADVPGISSHALQDAYDIFGHDVDDMLGIFETARSEKQRQLEGDGGLDAEGEDAAALAEEEDLDEEEQQRRAEKREELKRQRQLKMALRMVDPEMIAAHHLLPRDQAMREKDAPERHQLLGLDQPQVVDAELAAQWIYKHLFQHGSAPQRYERTLLERGILEVDGTTVHEGRDRLMEVHRRFVDEVDPITKRRRFVDRDFAPWPNLAGRRAVRAERSDEEIHQWQDEETVQKQLQESIKQVVTLFLERLEEVPLVAMYRKEAAGELLAMRGEDMPLPCAGQPTANFAVGTVQPKGRTIRRWDILWLVWEWMQKYRKLSRRRDQRLAHYQAILTRLESLPGDTQEEQNVLLACIDRLKNPELTPETLADVEARFQLLLEGQTDLGVQQALSQEVEAGASTKRPQRSGRYKALRMAGFDHALAEVVMKPAQFASNLEDELTNYLPPPLPAISGGPVAWAAHKVATVYRDHFTTEATADADLLTKLKQLASLELAAEPGVRTAVRSRYMEHATVATVPTQQGERVLDPFHKYGLAKCIRNKSLKQFTDTDLYLRMWAAERDGLVKVNVAVNREEVLKSLRDLYLSDAVSVDGKAWDSFRADVMDLLVGQLFPVYEQEARQKLLAEAKEVALRRYSDALWALATRAPLRIRSLDDEEGQTGEEAEAFLDNPRIMAACWGDGQPNSTVMVMLDEKGNLVDLLNCGQLSGMGMARSHQATTTSAAELFAVGPKARDLNRLKNKIMDKAPHAIVVGCSAPQAQGLYDDVQHVHDYLLTENARFFQDLESGSINLMMADEKVASLWEGCKAACEEFPEHSSHVRRAVALGRQHLDPLSLLAQLCGPMAEILSLPLTDLQSVLPKDDLIKAAEQVLQTAVAQVGVDINLAVTVPWRAASLPFVAGLGPRKAVTLLSAVQRNEMKVETRNEMYKTLGVLGKNVFRNCGAYLRVSGAGLPHLANTEFRVLDNSRVHPERYRLAVDLVDQAIGDEDVEAAVEQHPDKLRGVDLVALAEKNDLMLKMATLIDVHLELLAPNGEVRRTLKPLDELEVFRAMHDLSEDSLKLGRLVDAKVSYIGRDFMRCRLQDLGGIDAIVRRDNVKSFDDDVRERDLSVLFPDLKDKVIQGRIMEVKEETDSRTGVKRWLVELNCRGDHLRDNRPWEDMYCKAIEPNYDHKIRAEEPAGGPGAAAAAGKKQSAQLFPPRPIKHPLFQNVSFMEAEHKLEAEPVGTAIIRPAHGAKGMKVLNVSVKVYEGKKAGSVNIVLEAKEAPKPEGPSSHLRLATPLSVDLQGKTGAPALFEDLDELHAALVEPIVARYREVTSHRKFREGTKVQVDEQLFREWDSAGRGGVVLYGVFLDQTRNNMPSIAWVNPMSGHVHHEPLAVNTQGFWFRQKMFDLLDKALGAFKSHPDGGRQKAAGYVFPNGPMPQAGGWHHPSPMPSHHGAGAVHQVPPQYGNARTSPSFGGSQQQYGAQQYGRTSPTGTGGYGPSTSGSQAGYAAAGYNGSSYPPQQHYGGGGQQYSSQGAGGYSSGGAAAQYPGGGQAGAAYSPSGGGYPTASYYGTSQQAPPTPHQQLPPPPLQQSIPPPPPLPYATQQAW